MTMNSRSIILSLIFFSSLASANTVENINSDQVKVHLSAQSAQSAQSYRAVVEDFQCDNDYIAMCTES